MAGLPSGANGHSMPSGRKARVMRTTSSKSHREQPFIYTSGRYPSEVLHTTAAVLLAKHEQQDAALVYDLRHDPQPFLDMTVDELIEAWRWSKDPEKVRLPVKTVKYNRSPAVAPLGVIKDASVQERLKLDLKTISKNFETFKQHQLAFADKIAEAVSKMDKEREQSQLAILDNQLTVDERLYDGFIDGQDKQVMRAVRVANPEELGQFGDQFKDERLKNLLPLYKARNFPKSLTGEERVAWDDYCTKKLMSGGTESQLAKYFDRLQELAAGKLTPEQQYLLEELQLYGQSIVPADAID